VPGVQKAMQCANAATHRDKIRLCRSARALVILRRFRKWLTVMVSGCDNKRRCRAGFLFVFAGGGGGASRGEWAYHSSRPTCLQRAASFSQVQTGQSRRVLVKVSTWGAPKQHRTWARLHWAAFAGGQHVPMSQRRGAVRRPSPAARPDVPWSPPPAPPSTPQLVVNPLRWLRPPDTGLGHRESGRFVQAGVPAVCLLVGSVGWFPS
jgi:hypothetical protein